MTTKEAKKICLLSFLESLGLSPRYFKKGGLEAWFSSPFRAEKTESFKVATDKNTWYDFGSGEGGSILDFVIKYHGCSVGEAFQILAGKQWTIEKYSLPDVFIPDTIEIRSIKPLTNPSLCQYVWSRGIDIAIARLYLKEIYYRRSPMLVDFFGLGFSNRSGGYEIRSKKWKGCLLIKDLTFIEDQVNNSVSLFEGFFDLLAVLTDQKIKKMKSSVIVLNSNSQIDKAIRLIMEKGFDRVFAFLDNDESGKATFLKLTERLNIEVKDMRYLYQDTKDYNEFLLNKQKENKSS